MTEHRHYSGPDLAPLLRQVRNDLGSDAEIIRADRIRSGGLAGFFAREHYEVVAKQAEVEPVVSVEAAPQAARPQLAAQSRPAAEPAAIEQIDDEPISRPSPAGPSRSEASATAGGSGRSIQAALLDRADRVSTEELLVRVAETHSAEWGAESFQSILGRAMVDAVGPTVDSPSGEDRRRHQSRIDPGPDRPDEAIDGLRLDPVRSDENVIDPAPQPAPGEPSATEGDVSQADDHADPDPSPESAADDRWHGPPHGPVAPPWANDAPPSWGPPWPHGWAPWMISGWPGHAPADATRGPAPHLLCANCAHPVGVVGHDEAVTPPELVDGTVETSDAEDPWSELRREIDDVRLRLDDIIGTIRRATAGESSGVDEEPTEAGSDDDGENNRRAGRNGR